MKILHFYKTSFPDSMGGTEQVIHQISMGSRKLGVESEVLALTCDNAPSVVEVSGYKVHRAKTNISIASTGFSVSAFFQFSQLAKRADVVHYHFPWPFMDLVHFASRIKKPTVVSYHSDIVRQKHLLKLYRPLQNKFLGDVDAIVAASPNYVKTSGVLANYADKVSVIPYGIDKSSYPKPNAEIIEFWKNKFSGRFFLFVGMLRYYKGLHVLLEAAKGTNYPVVILGTGPVEMELKAQAAVLGLTNVYFLGKLSDEDKVALFTLCYATVFPSHLRSEAFGISLLEGAMFGKPMISCEIGTGTTFINIADETGLVVPPSDPIALRQAMQYLWENPVLASEMGSRAAERFEQLFTADKMVKSYTDLYTKMIG